MAGAGVLLCTLVGLAAAVSAVGGGTEALWNTINVPLGAVAATTALLLGVLLVSRWRLSGDAFALWVGLAAGFYGAGVLVPRDLLGVVEPGVIQPSALASASPAAAAVAVGLLVCAARSPEVDSGRRPLRDAAVALSLGSALLVPIAVLPPLRLALAGQAGGPPGLLHLAALTLAGCFLVAGMRRHRLLLAWTGVMLAGLGVAELPAVLPGAVLAAPPVRLAALLFGVGATLAELGRSQAAQRARLLDQHVARTVSESRWREAAAAQADLTHEARNALSAIEAATLTLELQRDQLDAEPRAQLIGAVSAEIARLQGLIGADRSEDRRHVDVAAIAAAQVALLRAQGADAHCAVAGGLIAHTSPAEVAEIVQNLLINAVRHGEAPILVTGARSDAEAVLRVHDHGPGVPAEARAEVFARRARADSAASGSGLGLAVSRQLARSLGGDLVYESRDRGACFALRLPATAPERPDSTSGTPPGTPPAGASRRALLPGLSLRA